MLNKLYLGTKYYILIYTKKYSQIYIIFLRNICIHVSAIEKRAPFEPWLMG